MVLHHAFPGTKYFGGHSDLLCGVLVVGTEDHWKEVSLLLRFNMLFLTFMLPSYTPTEPTWVILSLLYLERNTELDVK